jgi:hypothetical protein
MARPLAETITDMVETVRRLGPSPLALRIGDCGLRIDQDPVANPKSKIENPKSKMEDTR